MSDTLEDMSRTIATSSKLKKVVRIMKMIAASRIKECEEAATASQLYFQNVMTALRTLFSKKKFLEKDKISKIGVIIFGTDQGLVGSFNDLLASHAATLLKENPSIKTLVVGERMAASLSQQSISFENVYSVPQSSKGITDVVNQLLIDLESFLDTEEGVSLLLFHNHSVSEKLYTPVTTTVLPLNMNFEFKRSENMRDLGYFHADWKTRQIPEIIETENSALRILLREYLFLSICQALAESMASENVSRFLSMQHAENNINDLLSNLHTQLNLFRQTAIDAELFDIIAGFSALSNEQGT